MYPSKKLAKKSNKKSKININYYYLSGEIIMFLEKLNSATSKIKSLEEKLQDINLIKNQKNIQK